jgi:very-short-patch-repair endonuclease
MYAAADETSELIAAGSYGLITRVQALSSGHSARSIDLRLASGYWRELYPGVYLPRPVPLTWRGRLHGAVLWAGVGGAASHRAAASLHRLEGFRSAPLELSLNRRGRKPPGLIVHHRNFALPIRSIDGTPATSLELTLLDLHAVVGARRAGRALDDALGGGRTSLRDLYGSLGRYAKRGRRGVQAFRRALEIRDPELAEMHNVLERAAREAIARSRLPKPRKDHRVFDDAVCMAEIDFAWLEVLLGVEVDGHAWHSSKASLAKDKARDRWLELRGWLILRFTWDDVFERPDQMVEDIRSALILRGHPDLR